MKYSIKPILIMFVAVLAAFTMFVSIAGKAGASSCSDSIDDCFPPLTGECYVSPSSADIGEEVEWTASASGGNGYYSFYWTGTGGLVSDYQTVLVDYASEGNKSATVEITSYGETITRTCHVNINDEDEDDDDDDDEDLDVYCKGSPSDADVGDKIKWTAYPSGGDGDYDYDWDGDNNLNGDDKRITKTYNSSGRKDAEVEVRSNGERETAKCHIYIDEEKKDRDDDKIYLSSIPATGITPGMKTGLFASGLFIWSAFLGYLYIARRNEKRRENEALALIGE